MDSKLKTMKNIQVNYKLNFKIYQINGGISNDNKNIHL
jgi:hypothetical protein